MVNHLKRRGHRVDTHQFQVHMYVGDLEDDVLALKTFFGFIHNTMDQPTSDQQRLFLEKVNGYQKQGYLDFKDQVVIVKK